MFKVEVSRIGVTEDNDKPVIILVLENGKGFLPITIGKREAKAIALGLKGVKPPRPISYDLMKEILDQLEVSLKRVNITALKDGVFYARIELTHRGKSIEVDSRPSDAIALALRADAPIYITESVAEEAMLKTPIEKIIQNPKKEQIDEKEFKKERKKFREFLESVRPEDFGSLDELE